MVPRLLAVAGALLAIAGTVSGCATTAGVSATAASAAPTRLNVAAEHCGTGWTNPHAGPQEFVLHNTDIVTGEVFLVEATTGAVYAYVDDVAPGSTAELRVTLGSGAYSFRCAMSDEGVAFGATVTVPGSVRGTRAVQAVTDNDLVPVVKEYEAYVTAALPGLNAKVRALAADIRSGNPAAARRDWLPARLAYARLGAAYGAFGDTDVAVDRLATGLVGGTSDPAFTGFHRLEFGLWHGQSARELDPIASQLVSDVARLAPDLRSSSVTTLDIAIRTHEIVENALQFDLTGQSDYGSGTSLAAVSAELDGTRELLALMTPILTSRYPELAEANRALAIAKADVDAQLVHGAWTPLARLATAQRERINADISGLATLLAPVASICEPRVAS